MKYDDGRGGESARASVYPLVLPSPPLLLHAPASVHEVRHLPFQRHVGRQLQEARTDSGAVAGRMQPPPPITYLHGREQQRVARELVLLERLRVAAEEDALRAHEQRHGHGVGPRADLGAAHSCQQVVGLLDLLEGLAAGGVLVGVELERELAVRLADGRLLRWGGGRQLDRKAPPSSMRPAHVAARRHAEQAERLVHVERRRARLGHLGAPRVQHGPQQPHGVGDGPVREALLVA